MQQKGGQSAEDRTIVVINLRTKTFFVWLKKKTAECKLLLLGKEEADETE